MEEIKLKIEVERMEVQLRLEKELTKQLELKLQIAESNTEAQKLALQRQELFFNIFQSKTNKKASPKVGIDVEQLIKMYFTGYPSHHPYVYWQTICHFRAPSDSRMLENALKTHAISKYMKWLSVAPEEKRRCMVCKKK